MTLAMSTLTSSGIVLTADSRQTYTNRAGAIRIGSDNATKIFKLTDSCGVAISGRAFLNEEGKALKDVGYFIKKFAKTEKLDGLPVKEIGEKLCKYLGDLFVKRDIEAKKKEIDQQVQNKKGTGLLFPQSNTNLIPYTYTDEQGRLVSETSWIETIIMIVAGIDKVDDIGRAYWISIPQGVVHERDTEACGAFWVGQTDVVMRMVKGFAPEIENLNFVKTALAADKDGTVQQLNSLEYIINWGTITLQDAVDFCVLMTRTTESLQRFSDGIQLNQLSGIPGVGGEIDIAVITPQSGFHWLRKKKIKTIDAELSLEEEIQDQEEKVKE